MSSFVYTLWPQVILKKEDIKLERARWIAEWANPSGTQILRSDSGESWRYSKDKSLQITHIFFLNSVVSIVGIV